MNLAPPKEPNFIICSNASTVRLDDRLSNRQAQAHAGLLGRKEAVEQTRQVLSVDARAAIFDDPPNRLLIYLLSSNSYAFTPLRLDLVSACTAFIARLTMTCCN